MWLDQALYGKLLLIDKSFWGGFPIFSGCGKEARHYFSFRKSQEGAAKFGSILGRDRGLVSNCLAAAGRAPNWTGRALNSQFLSDRIYLVYQGHVFERQDLPERLRPAVFQAPFPKSVTRCCILGWVVREGGVADIFPKFSAEFPHSPLSLCSLSLSLSLSLFLSISLFLSLLSLSLSKKRCPGHSSLDTLLGTPFGNFGEFEGRRSLGPRFRGHSFLTQ